MVHFGSLGNTLKSGIVILSICFLFSVSKGIYHPSFTSLSDYDSATRVNVVDDAIIYSGNAAASLVAIYQDFMASSTIVYFFNYYLPPDRKPGVIMLLGFGLVVLAGYGRRRLKK